MTWNKRYDQYALSCGLRQSSERLQRWILRRAKRGEVCEIEIDLRVFNKFIERDRGRGYDPKTLKEALQQNDELTGGLILITKSYTWAIHKVIVRPVEFVLSTQTQKSGQPQKCTTQNPMFDADHKQRLAEQQQQDISKIEILLSNLGLRYTQDALVKLWRMAGKSVDQVKTAVQLMLHQHSTQKNGGVETPHGWLYECLRFGWQKGFDCYYQPKLPYLKTGIEIEKFVDGLCDRNQVRIQT
jgi:hypothetical protein